MSDVLQSIFFPKRHLEVVSIPTPLYKSKQGKYFVGQTEVLTISSTSNAWGALVNPLGSGVNLFANVFTVTNCSDRPLLAQLFFNAVLPGTPSISSKISPANTTLCPAPIPKVQLQFEPSVSCTPSGGVNVFDRIVPPGATLTSEEDGKFQFPPGGNWSVFLTCLGPLPHPVSAIVAFGWWEEKVCKVIHP